VCVLADLRARIGRARRDPADEPRRLERTVRGMEDRSGIAGGNRRLELLAPFDLEAVLPQQLELGPELRRLLVVAREPEAPDVAKRSAGDRDQRPQLLLGPAPQRGRALAPHRLGQHRIWRGASPQREAAVTPARAARDLARLVEAHPHAGLGERERARAPGDPAADDGDLGRPVQLDVRNRLRRLGEPVRRRGHAAAILDRHAIDAVF
jgi:hypothetical protein